MIGLLLPAHSQHSHQTLLLPLTFSPFSSFSSFSANIPTSQILILLIILLKYSSNLPLPHQPLKPDLASSKDPADVGNYHLRAPS